MLNNLNLLDNRVSDYCQLNNIFGKIRVSRKDSILYENSFGYADFENKIPFNDNSVFAFYSLSKPFCAIGLLKLVEKNLINLDSHPSVYLAEAKGFDKRVTIRQLLYHESGLPDFYLDKDCFNAFYPPDIANIRKNVEDLSAFPQVFIPGSKFRYSNINYILCALIIENVSGLKYSEYMKNEIFIPLDMNSAVIDDGTSVIQNLVSGHELIGGTVKNVPKSNAWMLGAGDIVGKVDDVYALHNAIKNRLLLSESSWNLIFSKSCLSDMGIGCMISDWYGKLRISHNGGHTGFRTMHILLPDDDFDIILLSNSGFGDARYALSEIIHDFFYGNDGVSTKLDMDKGYI